MKTAAAVTALTMALVLCHPASVAGLDRDRDDLWDVVEKLERRAYKVYDRAESRQHRFSRAEQGSLQAFYDLGVATTRLRERLERVRWDSRRATREFEALHDAYYRASGWLRYPNVNQRVRKDFRKVSEYMTDLSYVFPRPDIRSPSRLDRYDRRPGRVRVVLPRRPRVRYDVGIRIPWGRIRVSG